MPAEIQIKNLPNTCTSLERYRYTNLFGVKGKYIVSVLSRVISSFETNLRQVTDILLLLLVSSSIVTSLTGVLAWLREHTLRSSLVV